MNTSEDKESQDAVPSKEITMKFCTKCGQDDKHGKLGEKHFARGMLCRGGKIVILTYHLESIRCIEKAVRTETEN